MGQVGRWIWSNGALLCIMTVLLWAGHFVAARIAGGELDIPPFQLSFFRFFSATLILSVFFSVTWFTGRKETIRTDFALLRKHWLKLAAIGVLGHALFVSFVYFSLAAGPVPTVAVLQTTMPAVVVTAGFILFRDRLSLLQALGTGICIIGALLVVAAGSPANLLGLDLTESVLWMLGAVVMYGVFTVLIRIRPDGLSDLGFLWMLVMASLVFLSPFFVWNVLKNGLTDLTPGVIAAVTYITLGPGLAAAYFWNRGVRLLGSNRAGVFINLMPIFSGGIAWLVLGEFFAWYHLLGLIIIISGISLVTRKRAQ